MNVGDIVRVRSRRYLVEDVHSSETEQGDTLLRLACLDDDAQGQGLEVLWERELDAKVLGSADWDLVANRGFDEAGKFSAYLHTLKWNCVTATNPRLFQAPYRAGIDVKAYQLEPLRKALLQPRVSLFIADDVGLGKTIEAGLILREMILRQKVRRVVVACPPSVVAQWQEEMENRFGLNFTIYDRNYVASRRRERGYGINPWKLQNFFIISYALLRDESYSVGLREWLGDFAQRSMLILDEAHNAAPASSSSYAIDSQLTKVVRDIAPLFEHKLFLSATPHNGHSNSFASLLEMLDPQRFCRGVPVRNRKLLEAVMVRRLKQDLRAIGETDFPVRRVIPVVIDNLPESAPELVLSNLLREYHQLRAESLSTASKSKQRTALLVLTSLQKRLMSSIEAFARTLRVHRRGLERTGAVRSTENYDLVLNAPDGNDDRSELLEEELGAEEEAQIMAMSAIAGEVSQEELNLLDQMEEVAKRSRYEPDPKVRKLVEWIRLNLCPELGRVGAEWNDRRVLIFTEYADTKRYLVEQLSLAIENSDLAHKRIDTFHGGMSNERREAIKLAFNSDPSEHPLRILIATDAAREGVNLQNYCADLFHFDIPWNPSRMEQRNGRIDRKLQKSSEVRCHYFVFSQRMEDRVLEVLVKKSETIQQELGSLSPVVEKDMVRSLENGIWANSAELERAIDRAGETAQATITEELEISREEVRKLQQQREELEGMLQSARDWLGLSEVHLREALSASLDILGLEPLMSVSSDSSRWVLSADTTDQILLSALDSLRSPRKKGQNLWEWRNQSPVRPIVFSDPQSLNGEVVHLHLEHKLVKRLLGRFLAQGFVHNELSRACVCYTHESIPKVIVLGRLSLYGDRASRLHDEILAVTANWREPSLRGRAQLRPLSEGEKKDVLRELEDVLANPSLCNVPLALRERFRTHASRDVAELRPHLESRAEILTERAKRELHKRGEREAREMLELLTEQRDRIRRKQNSYQERDRIQQLSLFSAEEQRQLESDRRHWQKRLPQLEQEIETEPQKIREIYEVKASRVEPVGLVYLYPVSG